MAEYVPTTWVDDSAPGISATQLNRMEAGIAAALTITEKWQELTIGAEGAWTAVNLSAYGVADGNLVWIVLVPQSGGPWYGGARAVGSALERKEQLHGFSACFTLPVMAAGANATVELYGETAASMKAYLVGYVGL